MSTPAHRTALLGTVDRAAGEVHLERRYGAPVAQVWDALTDPARLSDWLEPVIAGTPGPDAEFVLALGTDETATCTVLVWAPPHELHLRWDYTGEGLSEVRIELVEQGAADTLLRLHHVRLPVDAVQYGAGWHVHMDNLAVHLAGGDVASEGWAGEGFTAAWEALSPRYAATDPAA